METLKPLYSNPIKPGIVRKTSLQGAVDKECLIWVGLGKETRFKRVVNSEPSPAAIEQKNREVFSPVRFGVVYVGAFIIRIGLWGPIILYLQ